MRTPARALCRSHKVLPITFLANDDLIHFSAVRAHQDVLRQEFIVQEEKEGRSVIFTGNVAIVNCNSYVQLGSAAPSRVASAAVEQANQDRKLPGPVERLFGFHAKGTSLFSDGPAFTNKMWRTKSPVAGVSVRGLGFRV
jgi:hypothetical protein